MPAPNRTILELKLKSTKHGMHSVGISQSNHTGIETLNNEGQKELEEFSQSNHTGIETPYFASQFEREQMLPIEPYWN